MHHLYHNSKVTPNLFDINFYWLIEIDKQIPALQKTAQTQKVPEVQRLIIDSIQ
jgi:hypothetical protein